MNSSHPRLIINLSSTSIDTSTLWLNNYLSTLSLRDWVIIPNKPWATTATSFATISSSFARLPEQQRRCPICRAVVLGRRVFGVGERIFFFFLFLTLHAIKLTKVQARARTYARVCKCIHTHVCTLWQVWSLTPRYSNPATADPRTLAFTRALASHLPTRPSCASHINSLASVTVEEAGRGVGVTCAHTKQHADMQTHTHPDTQRSFVVCGEHNLLTPWQVHEGSQSERRSLRAGLQVRDVPSP